MGAEHVGNRFVRRSCYFHTDSCCCCCGCLPSPMLSPHATIASMPTFTSRYFRIQTDHPCVPVFFLSLFWVSWTTQRFGDASVETLWALPFAMHLFGRFERHIPPKAVHARTPPPRVSRSLLYHPFLPRHTHIWKQLAFFNRGSCLFTHILIGLLPSDEIQYP